MPRSMGIYYLPVLTVVLGLAAGSQGEIIFNISTEQVDRL